MTTAGKTSGDMTKAVIAAPPGTARRNERVGGGDAEPSSEPTVQTMARRRLAMIGLDIAAVAQTLP